MLMNTMSDVYSGGITPMNEVQTRLGPRVRDMKLDYDLAEKWWKVHDRIQQEDSTGDFKLKMLFVPSRLRQEWEKTKEEKRKGILDINATTLSELFDEKALNELFKEDITMGLRDVILEQELNDADSVDKLNLVLDKYSRLEKGDGSESEFDNTKSVDRDDSQSSIHDAAAGGTSDEGDFLSSNEYTNNSESDSDSDSAGVQESAPTETDDQIKERLRQSFQDLKRRVASQKIVGQDLRNK